ncbi:class I SAM-dependent methyltransferase [soil metagenome]
MGAATNVAGTAIDRTCRLCGAAAPVFRGWKTGKFVPRDFQFFTCRLCDFTQVEPVTDFTIYNDAYYAGRGPDPLVNYEEEYQNYAGTPRRFEFSDLRRIAVSHLTQASRQTTVRWLDYGCGAGGLLKFLRDEGPLEISGNRTRFEVTGYDVGSYADLLRARDGFRILDEAELQAEQPDSYDIISCIEVVEHLTQPRAAVELLARLLRPGGLLLLTTGNMAAPLARWQGIGFAYCMPEIHISLFTPRALSRLYQSVGLIPRQVRFDGALRFRLLKNFPRLPLGRLLAPLASVAAARRVLDYVFGVSAMPCAVKPSPAAAAP